MENKVSFVQKNQEMFHKQEGCILAVHSLTNQRQDSLSKDFLSWAKREFNFAESKHEDRFKNMGDKIQKLEKETNILNEEIHVIHTTKLSWPMAADAELVDLGDRSRRNNLKFEGIKEHENESW